jgi:hypothetical protein
MKERSQDFCLERLMSTLLTKQTTKQTHPFNLNRAIFARLVNSSARVARKSRFRSSDSRRKVDLVSAVLAKPCSKEGSGLHKLELRIAAVAGKRFSTILTISTIFDALAGF